MSQVMSSLEVLLGNKESKIYLTCLELGKASIINISRKSGIPRSTCYLVIDDLTKKGLLSEIREGDKKFIIPESPEITLDFAKKEETTKRKARVGLEKAIPELTNLYNSKLNKTTVKYYEGEENLFKIIIQIINDSDNGEIQIIRQGFSDKNDDQDMNSNVVKEFLKYRDMKQSKSREIVENTASAKEYKEKTESENTQILLSPQISNLESEHIDKYITNNKVYIFNVEKVYAIVIEDRFIAQNERISFEVLWSALMAGGYMAKKENMNN
ncbi:hypothetical protein JW887_03935 [Candidatus Dojkabacteria bacterium]|nr:hypothetical protein [Candidatus Dojkabacteria bacterium]